jgi:hypothetical protein
MEQIENVYSKIIPKQMSFDLLNDMSKAIFGAGILYTYTERELIHKKTIITSEFCSDGFFWAQFVDELVTII